MNDLIGQAVLHYKIIDKLGEGGMGIVYKAEDTKLKRDVAIKFLPNIISKSKEDKTRFENEAQAAASLNHPNIATIHAIEEKDNQIFIVMEYINGPELKEKIDGKELTLEDSLQIIGQIANGLAAAHHKGIVHRDIKSSNIMLSQSGQAKIMDFGLAKVKGSSQITKVGTTIGTAAYMSPEQALGNKVDHRADIWAMGVIFYEMLTSQQPFKGEFEQAVIYSILNIEPEPVSTIKPDVPLKLEQITKKLLSKDVELRYQDVASFLEDLKEFKNKKTVLKPDNEKTIAVLPFENISPDKETDYFADGLAEELIINLSRIKEVSVVARTTSMQYKGTKKDVPTIGKELSVRYVMEGSVRKFKDDLRISVQFIDVSKGTQLWGETYKGKLEDVFDIQEKVSKEIVDALMLTLSPVEKVELSKRPTLNAEAFDCYLRGRNFLYNRTKSNLDFAILLFQKAVQLDSRFAAAYAGLGEAYGTMYRDFDRQESWLDKALDVSLKALMYDPSLSEAYASMGLAYFGKNQLDESLTSCRKAIELDPNNINAYWILSRIFISTDRNKEAIDSLEKLIKINPHFLAAYPDLHASYERLNDNENHNRIIKAALKVYPEYLVLHPEDAYRRMAYAVTLAKIGKKNDAKTEGDKALDLNPNDPIMMYYGACLYSHLDEKENAIDLLRRAIENGYQNFEWIKRDPDFGNIRKEPGFLKLIQGK